MYITMLSNLCSLSLCFLLNIHTYVTMYTKVVDICRGGIDGQMSVTQT